MQAYVREYLREFISEEVAASTRILYGGSVNEITSKELIKLKDVDGFLVLFINSIYTYYIDWNSCNEFFICLNYKKLFIVRMKQLVLNLEQFFFFFK